MPPVYHHYIPVTLPSLVFQNLRALKFPEYGLITFNDRLKVFPDLSVASVTFEKRISQEKVLESDIDTINRNRTNKIKCFFSHFG